MGPGRKVLIIQSALGTVKVFAQISLSLSEPAKTMINYSGKRDGAGNFLAAQADSEILKFYPVTAAIVAKCAYKRM